MPPVLPATTWCATIGSDSVTSDATRHRPRLAIQSQPRQELARARGPTAQRRAPPKPGESLSAAASWPIQVTQELADGRDPPPAESRRERLAREARPRGRDRRARGRALRGLRKLGELDQDVLRLGDRAAPPVTDVGARRGNRSMIRERRRIGAAVGAAAVTGSPSAPRAIAATVETARARGDAADAFFTLTNRSCTRNLHRQAGRSTRGATGTKAVRSRRRRRSAGPFGPRPRVLPPAHHASRAPQRPRRGSNLIRGRRLPRRRSAPGRDPIP